MENNNTTNTEVLDMDYNLTAKHIELTDEIKDAVNFALQHSDRIYDKIIDVNVILTKENHNYIAEAIMNIDGERLFVKCLHDDILCAVKDMGEKLTHVLRRTKEKRRSKIKQSIKSFV